MKYDATSQAYMNMLHSPEQLNEDVLMEDKIDFLKSKYPEINTSHDNYGVHRKSADVIDFLAQHADPTKNKSYLPWVVKSYHAGTFQQEDAPRIHDALSSFDKYKSKLAPEQRDINRYRRISDVSNATAHLTRTSVTRSEERDALQSDPHIPGKHEKLYEDDHIKIYHVADSKTSQKLYAPAKSKHPGAFPTEWCTAWLDEGNRRCRFDDHNKEGPLFVIHRKSDGEVFQFHPATDQFKDKHDDEIDSKTFASFEPHLGKAISQNFDKYVA